MGCQTTHTLNAKNIKPGKFAIFSIAFCVTTLLFGFVCVNADDFSEFRISNPRGHSYKLYQLFSNCTCSSFFYSYSALLSYEIVSMEIVLILVAFISLNPD